MSPSRKRHLRGSFKKKKRAAVRTSLSPLENRGEANICCSWASATTAALLLVWGVNQTSAFLQQLQQTPAAASQKKIWGNTSVFLFFTLYGLLGLISCFHLLRESVQWQGRSGQSNSEACHTVTWLSQHSGTSSGFSWHSKDGLHLVCFLKLINLKWMKNYLIWLLVLSFVTLERSSTPSSLCETGISFAYCDINL